MRIFSKFIRGTFLVLQGQPKDYGKKAKFVTQVITSKVGQTCALRFFYYMFGSQIGSLSVYIRLTDPNSKSTVTPLVIRGNQGQQWLRSKYQVNDQRPFQFIIEGQIGSGPLSEIAIDDVSFSEGCLPSNAKPPIATLTTSLTTGPHVTLTGGPLVTTNGVPHVTPSVGPHMTQTGGLPLTQTVGHQMTSTPRSHVTPTVGPLHKAPQQSSPKSNCNLKLFTKNIESCNFYRNYSAILT